MNRLARVQASIASLFAALTFATALTLRAVPAELVLLTQAALSVGLMAGLVGIIGELVLAARDRFTTEQTLDPYADLQPPYLPLPQAIRRIPNRLLNPAYGVVPFRGRVAERESLLGWCQPTPVAGVVLVTGPGGSGKTRLAAEICQVRKNAGWVAGFLKANASRDVDHLVETDQPVLVVIDYAETRIDQVVGLVERLGAARSTKPWRVLLVARDAGDWWTQIGTQTHDVATGSHLASAGVYALGAIDSDEPGQRDALLDATRAFATELGIPLGRIKYPDLPRSGYDRALYVQMAALSAVCSDQSAEAETPRRVTESSLVHDALRRERKYWRDTAARRHLNIADQVAARAVAVATLSIAHNEDEAETALQAVPDLEEESQQTRRRVADWLHAMYAGERDQWFRPLEPDLLGESNIAAVLEESPSLAAHLIARSSPEQARRALTVMTRAAQREAGVLKPLETAIAANLKEVWREAVDVAKQTGDPLGDILTAVISRDPRPEIVAELLFVLPHDTIALRALGEFATRASIDLVKSGNPDPDLLATLLNNHAIRLSNVRRLDEALVAIQEAVEVRRKMANSGGDGPRSDLAGVLINLAGCLDELGKHEDALVAAEEAADISRALAAARPEEFRAQLASSLSSLWICLFELGRFEQARAIGHSEVKLRRVLAKEDPESGMPALARSLSNYTRCLSLLGRSGDALEASGESVRIWRSLAEARHDEFVPNLAASLVNHSIELAKQGRREEALASVVDAVGMYRELSTSHAEYYDHELAASLVGLSNRLAAVGRDAESVGSIIEAVDIYRSLVASHPDAFRSAFAASLNNVAARLVALKRYNEALPAISEALDIRRVLAEANPDAFRVDLVRSLNVYSSALSGLGQQSEAHAVASEAEGLLRR